MEIERKFKVLKLPNNIEKYEKIWKNRNWTRIFMYKTNS